MKNIEIEFWRFAFAIYMVIYHTAGHVYGIRTGGYIGVDVFFIISGYFLSVSQKRATENRVDYLDACGFYYLTNRYKRLWPTYIVAYIISATIDSIIHFHSVSKGVERIYLSFPEMFMLRITASVNSVSWFVVAMLLIGLVLYVFLNVDRNDILKSSILPLMSLYIYGCFNESIGRIHAHTSHFIFPWVYDGLLRAFAGINLGIFVFFIVNKLQSIIFKQNIKKFLWYLGNIGFLSIIIISFYKFHGFFDFVYIFIAFLSLISLIISSKSILMPPPREQKLSKFSVNKIICYFGGLAYPIYLLHVPIFKILKRYVLINNPILGCIVVITITCIEAVLVSCLLTRIQPYFSRKIKKALFLKEVK